MTRLVRMAALGILAALALTACGDDPAPSGAQAETAERADIICEETQEKVGTLGDDAAADRDAIRAAADQIHAIEPANEKESIWLQFVADTDNLWLSLEDVAQSRDPSVADRARADRALTRVNETNARIIELADKYSMEICSDGGWAAPPPRSRRDS